MTSPIEYPEPYPGDVTAAEATASPCGRRSPNGEHRCGRPPGHPGSHAAGDGRFTRAIWTSAGAEWHAWPNPVTEPADQEQT